MNKKENPRSEFIIFRVSKNEKKQILDVSNGNPSHYIRTKLGLF